MRWHERDTVKFVELYRDHECLWNRAKASYKNRQMRQNAIEDIIQAMGQDEGFGATEVKQKIKNLRSTYQQEVQKIQKSEKSVACPNDVYQPSLKWFPIMDDMIKGRVKEPCEQSGETRSNMDLLGVLELENKQAMEEEETIDPPEKIEEQQQPPPPHAQPSLCWSGEATRPTTPTSSHEVRPREIKRCFQKLSQAVPVKEIKGFRSMKEVPSKSEHSTQENEAFGRYIASALDKLPQKEAIMAQSEIQNVLMRYRLSTIADN